MPSDVAADVRRLEPAVDGASLAGSFRTGADDRPPPAGKPPAIRPRSVVGMGARACPQDRPQAADNLKTQTQPRHLGCYIARQTRSA